MPSHAAIRELRAPFCKLVLWFTTISASLSIALTVRLRIRDSKEDSTRGHYIPYSLCHTRDRDTPPQGQHFNSLDIPPVPEHDLKLSALSRQVPSVRTKG